MAQTATEGASPKTVVVRPITQFTTLPTGVRSEFHVMFEIRTPEAAKKRAPVDLAVVLDRSGSMSGSKLKFAIRAVRKIIKHMKAPDRLHLITYDTGVDVVFENADLANKDALEATVKALTVGGMTNMSGGLQKGFDLLLSHAQPGENRTKRIFLFSDGHANVGMQKQDQLWELVDGYTRKGVTTAAFGIGSDFNEDLMQGISKHGKGDYFYIDSAEAIPRLVSKGIHGLMDLTGSECEFTARGKVESGAGLLRLYGREDDSKDPEHVLDIGDLHSGNTKNILVKFQVTPTSAGELPVVSWSLSYLPKQAAEGEQQGETPGGPDVTRVQLSGDVPLRFVDSSERPEENQIVKAAVVVQETADEEKKVLELVAAGRREEAVKKKSAMIDRLAAVEKIDDSGFLSRITSKARGALAQMRSSASREEVSKELKYQRMQCRRSSIAAYDSGDDSDEGEWSD